MTHHPAIDDGCPYCGADQLADCTCSCQVCGADTHCSCCEACGADHEYACVCDTSGGDR